jgi:tRNA1(Val) A37 N6-methylase TrmN6
MQDFNGDMFPDINTERREIKNYHLNILRDLLYGNAGIQKKLFFYSYKFNIIPLSLISSICEEFYHNEPILEKSKTTRVLQSGAFYTPPVLAEFVLSKALTTDILIKIPKILDPACGSGIFLVEAFRRIIRFNMNNGKILNFDDLKEILKNQITGIEINEDAARITAFSLNLALLNYLDPPSIIEQINKKNRLPNLIDFGYPIDKQNFNIIKKYNAFIFDYSDLGKFDIIIGNPPWGKVSTENYNIILKWCNKKNYSITKKETSQAFLLFSLDLLNNEGHCVMLVSSGVLLNPGAKLFRNKLFSNICIKDVFNFTHIRSSFFKEAISPFFLIHFIKKSQHNIAVNYWSAKNTGVFSKTQAIVFSKYDRALLVDQDLIDNKTWKINWFGRYADVRLISSLMYMKRLIFFVDRSKTGRGYENGEKECNEIKVLKTIVGKSFNRYSELVFDEPPKGFRRNGIIDAYYGNQRLLIRKGISQKGENKGLIICRYEKGNFCFNERIYAVKLLDESENNYFSLLGILPSSFARYYFFHTVSGWGSWHDGISLEEELLQFPIPNSIFSKKAEIRISITIK